VLREDTIMEPFQLKMPSTIGLQVMGDLFHPSIRDTDVIVVLGAVASLERHMFVVTTKFISRVRELVSLIEEEFPALVWPPKNLALGISCSTQDEFDRMVKDLFSIPLAVRIVLLEPLLGPITFAGDWWCPNCDYISDEAVTFEERCSRCGKEVFVDSLLNTALDGSPGIDGVIVGGEFGPNARPTQPEWVKSVYRECRDADTLFYFAGWGSWCPNCYCDWGHDKCETTPRPDPGKPGVMFKCGKHAGRIVDHIGQDELPWPLRDVRECRRKRRGTDFGGALEGN
jgi:protein gp37